MDAQPVSFSCLCKLVMDVHEMYMHCWASQSPFAVSKLQGKLPAAAWVPAASAAHRAHLIIEVAVHPEDIGMAQVGLDLNLPAQLVLHT